MSNVDLRTDYAPQIAAGEAAGQDGVDMRKVQGCPLL